MWGWSDISDITAGNGIEAFDVDPEEYLYVPRSMLKVKGPYYTCLLYTSDAADDPLCVDLGGRRINKNKKNMSST